MNSIRSYYEDRSLDYWTGDRPRDLRIQEPPKPELLICNSCKKNTHKEAKCLQRNTKWQSLPSVSIYHLQVILVFLYRRYLYCRKWWNNTELLGSWSFQKPNKEPQTEKRWETCVYVPEIHELPDSVIAVSGLSALLLPLRLLSSSSPLCLLNETHHQCNDAVSIVWHEILKYNNMQHSPSVWFHVLASCSSQQIDVVGRLVQMLFTGSKALLSERCSGECNHVLYILSGDQIIHSCWVLLLL